MAASLAIIARNAGLNAVTALLNSGYIDIYDGTRPATPETAITTQVKLARITFGATAFGAASAGSATANATTADPSAAATGTAAWARLKKSDLSTVIDCNVGTGASDVNLSSTAITIATSVALGSVVLSQPANC